MKKIRYTIKHNTVWKELYDYTLHVPLNFKGIYKGTSTKDCEKWLSNYKKERGLYEEKKN